MSQLSERIVILGGRGSIGRFLCAYFERQGLNPVPLSRQEIEIVPENHARVFDLVTQFKPSLILNLAGLIREHTLTRPAEDSFHLNGSFPQNAARHFSELQIPFVHLSTDCVFSGKNGPYSEATASDAEDIYGRSKAAGESAQAMVLRGSFLGPGLPTQKHGFFEWILAQKGKKISGFDNVFWNGITYLTLAKVIEFVATERAFQPGIYHLASVDELNRADLIAMVSRIFELGIEVTHETSPNPLDRRLIAKNDHFSKILNKKIEDQLYELRGFLTETGVN